MFQSSPGSREPGVAARLIHRLRNQCFNPRPAHVSRASFRNDQGNPWWTRFQSSPGSREPGVDRIERISGGAACFNPRPAHVSRASYVVTVPGTMQKVSILARLT